MATPKRYHPALVILHWLAAFFILLNLVPATFVLKGMPNTAEKIFPLSMHAAGGMIIAVLMIIRVIVRARTAHPAPATSGNPILDRLAQIVHILLYILAFSMTFSGFWLSVQSGLGMALMQGGALPANFFDFISRYVHGLIGNATLAIVLLHIGAALYHQFILKDDLLARMWFGKN
jgi:cytochrome b561